MEKCVTNVLGSKPKTIRTLNKTTFTIEVQDNEQSAQLAKLRNSNGIDVKVAVNKAPGANRGLVYVYQYNLADMENFKQGLMNDYGLVEVVDPT